MPCLYTLQLDKEYNFNTHEEYNNFLRNNIGLVNKYIAEKEKFYSAEDMFSVNKIRQEWKAEELRTFPQYEQLRKTATNITTLGKFWKTIDITKLPPQLREYVKMISKIKFLDSINVFENKNLSEFGYPSWVQGSYNPNQNEIYVKSKDNLYTILHETNHALFSIPENFDNKFKEDINFVISVLKQNKDVSRHYAFSDPDPNVELSEFLAEVLINEELQKDLAEINVGNFDNSLPEINKSLWDSFVSAVKNLFKRKYKINTEETLLDFTFRKLAHTLNTIQTGYDNTTPQFERVFSLTSNSDNFFDTFDSLPNFPNDNIESVIKTTEEIATYLAKKFGIGYKFVNEPDADWRGKFQDDVVYLNKAHLSTTTVWHEYSHPLVRAVRKSNPALFENLKNQIDNSDYGNKIKNVLFEKYPELTPNSDNFYEESIVIAISDYVANKIDENKNKSLIGKLKEFLNDISDKLKKVFRFSSINLAKLDKDITIKDLAGIMMFGGKVLTSKYIEHYENNIAKSNNKYENLLYIKIDNKNNPFPKFFAKLNDTYQKKNKIVKTTNVELLRAFYSGVSDFNMTWEEYAKELKFITEAIDMIEYSSELNMAEKLKFIDYLLKPNIENSKKELYLRSQVRNVLTVKDLQDLGEQGVYHGLGAFAKSSLDTLLGFWDKGFTEGSTLDISTFSSPNIDTKEAFPDGNAFSVMLSFDENTPLKYVDYRDNRSSIAKNTNKNFPTFRYSTEEFESPDKAIDRIKNRSDNKYSNLRPHTEYFLEANLENVKELVVYNSISESDFDKVKLFAKKWGIPVKIANNQSIMLTTDIVKDIINAVELVVNDKLKYGFNDLLLYRFDYDKSIDSENKVISNIYKEINEEIGLLEMHSEDLLINGYDPNLNYDELNYYYKIKEKIKENEEELAKRINLLLANVKAVELKNDENISKVPYKPRIKYSKLSKQESLVNLPETKLDKYTQLFEEHLAQLQSKFPNIKVNVIESNNKELGWVSDGEVFINKNKFTLATPIHEFAHVYLAILKDSDYEKYSNIINSVEGLKYYEDIKMLYSDAKTVEDVKEETFVYLLGEQFAERLLNPKDSDYESSIKNKVVRAINRFLKDIAEILGASSMLNLQNTDKYIQQVTNEILNVSEPVTITSEQLSSLMNDVKYQKTLAISDVNDLLKFISGKSLNANEDSVRHTVGNITNKYDGKDFFYLSKEDEKSNTNKRSFMGVTDVIDRKKIVEKALREKLDDERSADMNNIVNFYKLSKEERLEILSSPKKEDKYYYTVVDKLFEYFREGDRVVSYSDFKNTNPEFYSSELDNKNTLVHIGANQKFTVVNITNLGVRNGEKEETIFNGLAGKSTLAGASNVNTSNSNQDLNALQATLISMFITKNGGKVQKVAVGKFDKKVFANTPVTIDTAKELKTLKYLRKINAVNEQLFQTKDMKTLLVDTKEDDKIFSPITYQSSYLQLLKDTYEDFNTENYTYSSALREELDNYLTSPKDISHIEKLRNTIKKRLEYLSRELSDADQKQSKEFILLSEVLRSVDSGYEHTLNAHKNLGSIERWYTSFLSISNKYVAWWLKGFEARRFNLTDKWLKDYKGYNGKVNEKGGMIDVFESLIKDYEKRNPAATLTTRVLNDTTKYFDNLFLYKEVNYTDKNGNTSKVKVNTFKLKSETDKELTDVEKETIIWIKNHIKNTIIANYKLNNPKPQDKTAIEWEEAIEEWYSKTSFGQGAIPIVKSTVASKLFNSGENSLTGVASKKLLDNFLNLNTYYESKPEDFTKIPDYFSYQTSNDLFNEKVGLDFNSDYAIDGWQALQADVETDLAKALDIFTLQNYKQEFMKDLIPMWKAATAMINKADIDMGIKQLGEDTIKSNTEDILDKIVKSLLFGQKITAKTAGEQKLAKFIDTITTMTTFGTVALAPFTSLKSFLSNVSALITNAMKNSSTDYKYSLEDLYWAFKTMTKEFDKAVMLATELRVFNADEFDMVTSLQYSAHKFSLLRSVNAFILDLGADRFIKLMILLAQSKKDKTWYAYKWDKDKLLYDEATDRKNRGEKVVDEIKLNQMKEKALHPNAKMKSAFDSGSRLVYEKLNSMVLGGYTDLTATAASTSYTGKLFSQMRKYLFARTEKAFRDEEYNDNEVYYKQDKDGEVVRITPFENGQYKSFIRMASIFYNKYFGLTSEQISDMSMSDRENLKSMLVFTLSAVGFMVMQSVFEDDENNKKTRSVYDSLISDMFILDNAKTTIDAFRNPFISMSFMSKLMDISKDIVVGDLKDANNKLFKTVGVLKTYDFFTTLGK